MSDRIAVIQHGTVVRVSLAEQLTHNDLVRASAAKTNSLPLEVTA